MRETSRAGTSGQSVEPEHRSNTTSQPTRELRARALSVLARGFVHKLNNCLAVISTHAQVLEAEAADESFGTTARRDTRALTSAVERSRSAIGVVDELLHDKTDGPTCVGSRLRALAGVLLCERDGMRYPVEVAAPAHVFTAAPGSALTVLTCLLVDELMKRAPLPVPGAIAVEVRQSAGAGPQVTLGFRLGSGHLPFRVPSARPEPVLLDFARGHDILVAMHEDPGVYWLGLPATPA